MNISTGKGGNVISIPLATVNQRLQHIAGVMSHEDLVPESPNFLANIQDLLEDAGIDAGFFATLSQSPKAEKEGWPAFIVVRKRLLLRTISTKRKVTAENLFSMIREVVHLKEEARDDDEEM